MSIENNKAGKARAEDQGFAVKQQSLSSLIWSVADLIRGPYKPHEYGGVILPFTVLRRLDCVLAPTKAIALATYNEKVREGTEPDPFVRRVTGLDFFNTSSLDMTNLLGDQDNIRANLESYVQSFSPDVRSIFEHFNFAATIEALHKAKLLYMVIEKFANIDLHPNAVDNIKMGLAFEELIRKFAEASNATAGDHFTPREVIRLMVNLLFIEDDEVLMKNGVVRSMYDPTAGTGGMLSVAGEYLHELNPNARLTVFGQEFNAESHAICKADMLIKGQNIANIVFGNTLTEDGLIGKMFDYMLSNPPFGVEWKNIQKEILKEFEQKGFAGRFGPGLPRVSDGSLLFLLHLISKMRPAEQGGSRIGIVLNGSPLFTGGAGSGESEIRRYVLENDLVEAIVALPSDMFYNTGIATYIWILTNRKVEDRKGFVQLIDASSFWQKMRKALGSKRKEMNAEHIADVTRMFGDFVEANLVTVMDADGKEMQRVIAQYGDVLPKAPAGGSVKEIPVSKIMRIADFGYRTITVERPLLNESGKPVLGDRGKLKGKKQPDPSLRDTENVPMTEDVGEYFKREVLPHAPDAWIDEDKTKVGYEIPFNRHFYVFEPPRELSVIDAALKSYTDRIKGMIDRMAA
ncbi:MAG: class I SAM-dependent DNA methyltransferase [Rhodoferax sp.]|nr:class I SAM-dependent DNA methyltransferase [Rhodoferax sp.]